MFLEFVFVIKIIYMYDERYLSMCVLWLKNYMKFLCVYVNMVLLELKCVYF